jgi:hypothetical protein
MLPPQSQKLNAAFDRRVFWGSDWVRPTRGQAFNYDLISDFEAAAWGPEGRCWQPPGSRGQDPHWRCLGRLELHLSDMA